MFWVGFDARLLSVQSVSVVGDCKVTDGPEAPRHGAEQLSNVTESEEKASDCHGDGAEVETGQCCRLSEIKSVTNFFIYKGKF